MTSREIVDAVEDLLRASRGRVTNVPLPTNELIAEYAKRINFNFPDDYKYLLIHAGNVFYGVLDPLIITSDGSSRGELYEAVAEAREIGVPGEFIPICCDNGDYYCINESGTVIFFTPDGVSDEKWNSIADWIRDVWLSRG